MIGTTDTITYNNDDIMSINKAGCLEKVWMENTRNLTLLMNYSDQHKKRVIQITRLMRGVFGRDSVEVGKIASFKIFNKKALKKASTRRKIKIIEDSNFIKSIYRNNQVTINYKNLKAKENKVLFDEKGYSRIENFDFINNFRDSINTSELFIKNLKINNFKKISINTDSGRKTSIIIQFFRFITMDNYGDKDKGSYLSYPNMEIFKTIDAAVKKFGYNYEAIKYIFSSKNYTKIHSYWRVGGPTLSNDSNVYVPKTLDGFNTAIRKYRRSHNLKGLDKSILISEIMSAKGEENWLLDNDMTREDYNDAIPNNYQKLRIHNG